jgi:hypothetical protein
MAPVADNSKLKGVQWPGMSIFDSATPLARRRRNQKKDASILEQLETNSLDVEPTEFVWTPGGRLKKQKEISGLPSSSSPMKSPANPTLRAPLVDIKHRHPWNVQLGGPRYNGYTDERLEDSLTYGNGHGAERRKKRPFPIWQDEEHEPEVLDSFGHPQQFTYLTRGFQTHPERDEENRPRDDRRRTRSYFRNSEIDFRPFENLSQRRAHKQETHQDLVNDHRNVTAHSANGISSLLAAAENTDRSMTADPWFLNHHHHNHDRQHSNLANIYAASGMFPSDNHHALREATSSNHRHEHSLSIDALLNVGCPTTSGISMDNGGANTIGHTHNFGYGSASSYGLGVVMASPVRPHPIHPGWDNFWHGVHSIGTGNGFWGYNAEDHQLTRTEDDAIVKFDDNADAASVGDRPGEAKIRLGQSAIGHDNAQDHDERLDDVKPFGLDSTGTGADANVYSEMDDDMTVSVPPSPHQLKGGMHK